MDVNPLEIDEAPDAAKPWLESAAKSMGGFLPNLYKEMANAPVVLEAYLTLSKLLSKTSFSFAEQQLILLTASARNGCKYCVAAHSSGARMAKLDGDAINAVRDGRAAEDAKLQAQAEGERIRQQAQASIDQEINQARESLRTQVAELSVLGAEKILQDRVDEQKHASMLDQLAAKL